MYITSIYVKHDAIKFQIDPKASNRHISGTVTDIATKLQSDVRRVTAFLPADYGVDSSKGLFLAKCFTGFRDFLNANNSEAAEANPLELRLLRGSSCRYESAKSEICRFSSKKVSFRTFDPTVSRGVG
jgi:hypothetical protein